MGRNKYIMCNVCNRTVRKDHLPPHSPTNGIGAVMLLWHLIQFNQALEITLIHVI